MCRPTPVAPRSVPHRLETSGDPDAAAPEPDAAPAPAPARAHDGDAARDGPPPRRAPGAGEPAAVPLARRADRGLRPVRRHHRPRGPLARAAAHMRGTVHLLPAEDAGCCGRGRSPCTQREIRSSGNVGQARDLDLETVPRRPVRRARRRPCPRRRSGPPSSTPFPDQSPTQLGQLARLGRAARPGAAARHLEGQRRGGLPVRRPLGRPGVDRAGRPRDRPPLPARLRAGLGRRRDGLVGDHPAGPGAGRHGRPRPARGRERQGALRRPRRRARRRGRPRTGAAPRRLRQRLALARQARPGHRPRRAHRLDGRERRQRVRPLRRRLADRALESRWTAGSQVLEILRTLTKQERSELDEEIGRVEALLAR